MKTLRNVFLLWIVMACVNVNYADACRFWCALGDRIPDVFVLNQMLNEDNSLKSLGVKYQDGWSVGYVDHDKFKIMRSDKASNVDRKYESSVKKVAEAESDIVVGHLRRASSGCVEGVPNPHPFVRQSQGKEWIFGHNGGMKKSVLIDLIGEKYLSKNSPLVCTDNPPETWIDSELYFIFLLQQIEHANGQVEQGLKIALEKIYSVIPEENRYLNFFLSDGKKLWSFRKGLSLFYLDDKTTGLSAVSSSKPDDYYGWKEFPENTIAVLDPENGIQFLVEVSQKIKGSNSLENRESLKHLFE